MGNEEGHDASRPKLDHGCFVAIEKQGGTYLESYALFDIYEGAQIKEGYKSLAYSIVFRAQDKTLEDAEVTEAMNRILKELEGMGIELRK